MIRIIIGVVIGSLITAITMWSVNKLEEKSHLDVLIRAAIPMCQLGATSRTEIEKCVKQRVISSLEEEQFLKEIQKSLKEK